MLVRVEEREGPGNKRKCARRVMVLRCDECGKEYEKGYNKKHLGRLNFCTSGCSNHSLIKKEKNARAHIGKKSPTGEVVCSICGQLFIGTSWAKFCSDECRKINRHHLEQSGRTNNKLCAFCGVAAIRFGSSAGYCSDLCEQSANNELSKKYDEIFGGCRYQKHNVCAVCGRTLIGTRNLKYCSEECFKIARKIYRDNKYKIILCRYCEKEHRIYKSKHSQFCSRWCASKWYIENTNKYNEWRYRTNNHEQDLKRCETIKRRYGVDSAFILGTHGKNKSKGQIKLYESLCGIFPSEEILLETNVPGTTRMADILFVDLKLEVAHDGDFFHCNPSIYEKDFKHPLKQKTAQKIWEEDARRCLELESAGYKSIHVWETDFKKNPEMVLKYLAEKINERRREI